MSDTNVPLKKYPIVGACGLECGLCPRYHTDGPSRCPGCGGEDFGQKHPSCGFITCCVKRKGLEACAQCAEWETCQRLKRSLAAGETVDSFISYRPLAANLAFIRENGLEAFVSGEREKIKLLRYLIENYNEGRSKSYYCLSCQLLPLDDVREVVAEAEKSGIENLGPKEKAKILKTAISSLADRLNIDLKLRKGKA